jgi:hypothetical protein
MVAKAQKLALTLPDYQRMHRVIASVLNSVEANTPRACLFFAVAGAFLIETIHKRPARPVGGAAFYRVDDKTGFVMAFGRLETEDSLTVVSSDDKAFHCWIESEGMAIDLMSPIFQESVWSGGRKEVVPRKMFQRSLSAMAHSPHALESEGDFFFQRDPELSQQLLNGFMAKPANGDLVRVCEYWYRPHPKAIQPAMQMGSDDGSVRDIKLGPVDLIGAW